MPYCSSVSYMPSLITPFEGAIGECRSESCTLWCTAFRSDWLTVVPPMQAQALKVTQSTKIRNLENNSNSQRHKQP